MLHASDQAAGLRRLFRRAPSAVVALFASGRAPRQLAVFHFQLRANQLNA